MGRFAKLGWSGILVLLAGCASGRGGSAGDPSHAGAASTERDPAGAAASPAGAVVSATDPSGVEPSAALLVGGCGVAPIDLVPRYVLPFPSGGAHELTQGNCGGASHDGRFRYAFDFRMPVGTPLVAARDGVVLAVRDDRPDGTRRVGDENYVFVAHGDGEISRYIHLTRGGALVAPGDSVARGDTIALSGHSGRSVFPHLHFDVARGCSGEPCVTVPVAFLNANPPIPNERRLVEARTPTSEAPAGDQVPPRAPDARR